MTARPKRSPESLARAEATKNRHLLNKINSWGSDKGLANIPCLIYELPHRMRKQGFTRSMMNTLMVLWLHTGMKGGMIVYPSHETMKKYGAPGRVQNWRNIVKLERLGFLKVLSERMSYSVKNPVTGKVTVRQASNRYDMSPALYVLDKVMTDMQHAHATKAKSQTPKTVPPLKKVLSKKELRKQWINSELYSKTFGG